MTRNQHKIADFLSNLSFDTLPQSVIHQARRIIMDTLGCLLAGIPTPLGKRVAKLGDAFPHPGGATIIGSATDRSPFIAAMAHGFMANALDGDDGHRASRLHAGGVIVPAALAAAEENDCGGQRFIEAIVAGYELAHRAGIVSQGGEIYFGSAYGSTFGAAAACAHILGLPVDETLSAMGIADMHAPNCMLMGWIEARSIPMIKEGMGWSAATGLMAAQMAKAGITGTLAIFEGREDISRIEGLGKEYEIEKNYFKPYPCCRWSHAPLENLLELRRRHALTPEIVTEIEVRTFGKAARLDQPEPPTAEDAQYSIPFILGTALVEGNFTPGNMAVDRLTDQGVLSQARKVKVMKDPEIDASYPEYIIAQVSVTTTDGRVLTQSNQSVPGDWNSPLSDDQLQIKFKTFTRGIVKDTDRAAILHKVNQWEKIESMQQFIREVHQAAIQNEK
jgi:2-methylcitrate dehydratase PrpD